MELELFEDILLTTGEQLMDEALALKSRTLEMLSDTFFFEKNITDSRLAVFQKCFTDAVNEASHLIGCDSRDALTEKLENLDNDEIWNTVTRLFENIKSRVDSKMSLMSELFFKGDEMDNVSRVFLQSTFQRVRRIISTAKGEHVKLVSELLYRLIILAVLCQYRNESFKEAFA